MKKGEIASTAPWPKHPVIYEINAWTWLSDLGRKHATRLGLGQVPAEEWDLIASHSCDAVWLMGVWERSPAGIAISMNNPGLLEDFRRALPDFSAEDNVGSPYCVRRYVVDAHLGGPVGLAAARQALAARGMRLVLDFVPNHVAPDHPWVREHPEYFIHGSDDDLARDPSSFIEVDGRVLACGRDPFFPAWPDVLQLNAFQPALRSAVIDTLAGIAAQCDAVRCDMSMLVLNQIFERTWGDRAGAVPRDDYWRKIVPAVKAARSNFRFIAEAYWDLEWELQQQGFDYCYDKKLYDRMEHGAPEQVRQHLLADLSYQAGMVRFIENHDEPRAAIAFPADKGRAAAVTILTLPGAKLLHEGQFDGFKVRLPVFLARRRAEPVDRDLAAFYARLLDATGRDLFRNGDWRLCERTGWPDNQTCQNILAWCWELTHERSLVVINAGPQRAQALVHPQWKDLDGRVWRLDDLLSGKTYNRNGTEMHAIGLYVDLEPWECHLFEATGS